MIKENQHCGKDQIAFTGVDALTAVKKGDELIVDGSHKEVADVSRFYRTVKVRMCDGTIIKRTDSSEFIPHKGEKDVMLILDEDVSASRVLKGLCTEGLIDRYISWVFAGVDADVVLKKDGDVQVKIYEKDGYYFVYSTQDKPNLAYQRLENAEEYGSDRITDENLQIRRNELNLFHDIEDTAGVVAAQI